MIRPESRLWKAWRLISFVSVPNWVGRVPLKSLAHRYLRRS